MPEKKKQHYVPRFYLKYFSIENEGSALGIYNLDRKKYIPRGSLKNQAYEDYFYDEEGKMEEVLSQLENTTANILDDILKKELPEMGTENHATLLTFVILLSGRTKYKANAMNEMVDSFLKKLLKYDPEFQERIKEGDTDLEDLTIELNYPAVFALNAISDLVPLVSDLQFSLLINNSPKTFLTSDNPIVMYNQYLEKRETFGGNTGLAAKGLQILFPLTPKKYLIFYDSKIYNVGNQGSQILEVKNKSDVNEINTLQFVNANENLFFNHEIKRGYLTKLEKLSKRYLKDEKTHTEEYKPVNKDSEKDREILLHYYEEDTETNLDLSFISETEYAKSFNLGNKTFHCRNRKLLRKILND